VIYGSSYFRQNCLGYLEPQETPVNMILELLSSLSVGLQLLLNEYQFCIYYPYQIMHNMIYTTHLVNCLYISMVVQQVLGNSDLCTPGSFMKQGPVPLYNSKQYM